MNGGMETRGPVNWAATNVTKILPRKCTFPGSRSNTFLAFYAVGAVLLLLVTRQLFEIRESTIDIVTVSHATNSLLGGTLKSGGYHLTQDMSTGQVKVCRCEAVPPQLLSSLFEPKLSPLSNRISESPEAGRSRDPTEIGKQDETQAVPINQTGLNDTMNGNGTVNGVNVPLNTTQPPPEPLKPLTMAANLRPGFTNLTMPEGFKRGVEDEEYGITDIFRNDKYQSVAMCVKQNVELFSKKTAPWAANQTVGVNMRRLSAYDKELPYKAGDVIHLGKDEMKRSNVVLVGLARNNGQALKDGVMESFNRLGDLFKSFRFIAVENDSDDDTVEVLKKWAARRPGSQVHSYKLGAPKFLMALKDPKTGKVVRQVGSVEDKRFHYLAILRNVYLSALHHPSFNDVDYVLVADMDLKLGYSWNGLAHSIGLRAMGLHWGGVCSNGVIPASGGCSPTGTVKYYGSFYDSLAFRDEYFTKANFRRHESVIHRHSDDAYYVDSCFGGMAIYTKQAMGLCNYDATDDCEHIMLHKCMKELDQPILFNPRQVVKFSSS